MKHHFRNKFLAGIFAAIPVAVTAFVIYYVETKTRILTRMLFGRDIPFLGILIALAALYLFGLIVTSLLGRWFLSLIDRLLSRIPGLRELYVAWKQVTLTPGSGQGIFTQVVAVADSTGHSLGFCSGDPLPHDPTLTCVFIPAAPNPINGRLYFVPISRIKVLSISPEDAFKYLLSGGNFIPEGVLITASAHSSPA